VSASHERIQDIAGPSRPGKKASSKAWDIYRAQVEAALTVDLVFSGVKWTERKRRYRACCPLHGGDNPQALSVDPSNLRWVCHTGCTPDPGQEKAGGGPVEYVMRRDGCSKEEARDHLAELVGVDLSGTAEAEPAPLDGDALAAAWSAWCARRKLDRARLAELDCCLIKYRRRPAVTYPTPMGDRVRYLDDGKKKYAWRVSGVSTPTGWYGLGPALDLLEIGGRLYVVNGEPSVWACLQSGVPAVCTCFGEGTIPGPDLAAGLASAVEGAGGESIGVVLDLDQVGRTSAPKWIEALKGAGAAAVALELPETLGEHGDVDDLHQSVGDGGLDAALVVLPRLAGPPEVVSNFEVGDDGDRYEVSQDDVIAAVHRATDDWPRVCTGLLFAANSVPAGELPTKEAIRYLDGQGADAKLMTWLRKRARVEWCGREVLAKDREGKRNPLTRAELHRALEMDAPHRYDAVELLPHEPRRPRTYYACGNVPSGKGSALAEFMGLLNPDTEADADLLCAALVTPGWGGDPGTRPGFVITSDHGVGSGKTATAVAISDVWQGAMRLQPETEDWATTVQRLLSDAALSQRIVLIDNLRGKLSSGAIESAITESVISGKRMYHGEFSRPNTLTWLLTVNIAELSRDLADRCVVIRIGKPLHGIDFKAQVADLLRRRHHELVTDCLGFLRAAPRCEISQPSRDRFQAWQTAVLSRFPGGDALAAEVIARRPVVDADSSEAGDAADAIETLLRARGHCPVHERVFMPIKVMYEVLADEVGVRSKSGLTRKLKQLSQHGPLRSLERYKYAGLGRGFLWRPPTELSDRIFVLNDMASRVECPVCGLGDGGRLALH